MEKITLELNSYNLDDAIGEIVARVMDENKYATDQEIADILGISTRSLIRYRKKYNIEKMNAQTIRAMRLLENMGYTISKEED